MADTSVKQQIVDKIKDSNTILVTVNNNPSVDELSAALGITLLINKLNKHATAVFSGNVPPAIEFLKPEKTFENTVDSLRDFIIALDKEKADHLRYKVDGDMVKIFITPYRTTISEADLDFSQGDYNVECVLAIGVKNEADLDKALESHGRILHDATIAVLSLDTASNLGGLEWVDAAASSYCEMLFSLSDALKNDKKIIDEQIANAFLTGIVAATDRFSNSKTSSNVMTISAQLMSAGANQQLIATELQKDNAISVPTSGPADGGGDLKEGESAKVDKTDKNAAKPDAKSSNDTEAAGALSISHEPAGDVDEVAKQVATEQADNAAKRAEDELSKQTQAVASDNQAGAVKEAEQKLTEQLKATPPAPEPLRGPVSSDQWKAKAEGEAAEPALGGTLNATTEQAEVDKRKQLDDDRNRTILSHSNGKYASEPPKFQAPLNAVADVANEPSKVPDIFSDNNDTNTTSHADIIQPPPPVAHTPTLAEIDSQNRAAHSDAMSAVHAAYTEPAKPPAPGPVLTAPGLPPLPPMPDFSTLPPLPGSASPVSIPADNLGNILPPADSAPQTAPQPVDPAAFRIPGQ